MHCRIWCSGSDGCGCVELGRTQLASQLHTTTAITTRTPYAAMHTLVLLMMGIMMPETC